MNRMEILLIIRDYVLNSPLNTVKELSGMKIYDAPLVGFAVANDTLFSKLRDPQAVGTNHMLPEEWLLGAKAVISYFLPFSQKCVKPIGHLAWQQLSGCSVVLKVSN